MPSTHTDKQLHSLCPYITKRYSDKLTYSPTPIPLEILTAIDATRVSAMRAYTTNDAATIQEIATLQNEAVIVDVRARGFGAELAKWLRPNNTRSHDGMPGFVAGLPSLITIAGKLVMPHLKASGIILG